MECRNNSKRIQVLTFKPWTLYMIVSLSSDPSTCMSISEALHLPTAYGVKCVYKSLHAPHLASGHCKDWRIPHQWPHQHTSTSWTKPSSRHKALLPLSWGRGTCTARALKRWPSFVHGSCLWYSCAEVATATARPHPGSTTCSSR